jgi:hypothetical protein
MRGTEGQQQEQDGKPHVSEVSTSRRA